MRERSALLDMVIGEELEVATLRKDCCFIVNRTIFETKDRLGSDLIAVGDLDKIT